jgi:hypothetical protein
VLEIKKLGGYAAFITAAAFLKGEPLGKAAA